MSWRYVFGRDAAKGYKLECFLGDDTRTWMWNWRVPGRFASPCKSASRRFMLWMRGKDGESVYGILDYIHMVQYKKRRLCSYSKQRKCHRNRACIYATYANVSLVPSTRSMYSFSSSVSIAWRGAHVNSNRMRNGSRLPS